MLRVGGESRVRVFSGVLCTVCRSMVGGVFYRAVVLVWWRGWCGVSMSPRCRVSILDAGANCRSVAARAGVRHRVVYFVALVLLLCIERSRP